MSRNALWRSDDGATRTRFDSDHDDVQADGVPIWHHGAICVHDLRRPNELRRLR